MNEHVLHPIITFTPFGIDLSVTHPVLVMWGTTIFIFIFLLLANVSKRVRNIEAFLFDFVSDAFGSSLHTQKKIWFSFLFTLFLFIFFNNVSSLLPAGEAPTSNINVTAAMAILIFLISQFSGMFAHGVFHHFKNIVPSGIPPLMLIFFVPLEIVSQLARPFSLAVRLFANMFAGHKVLTIFVSLAIVAPSVIKLLPFGGVVLISMFEIFVSFIQAFIFTYLASFYISEAVSGSH